jgi:hypothetical protein
VDLPSQITTTRRQEDGRASLGTRPALSRRRALTIAGALAGVLGVGWLADALASLPPRRSAAGPQFRQAGAFVLSLTPSPAVPAAGESANLSVTVRDLADQPTAPARFRGALGMPAMGMDPVDLAWAARSPGNYQASVAFPMAGSWTLTVMLQSADQRSSTAQFDIAVR